jgi:dihydroceramide fatty acyl 2-hydroxylase
MPRKVSADDPTRLYESDLLERITRAHPAEPFLIFGPAVGLAVGYALLEGPLRWWAVALVLAAGFTLWTFAEYLLHRYLFHYEATTAWGKRQMKLIHGIHHQFPNDTDRLVIPPTVGFFVALGFLGLYCLLFGWHLGVVLMAGFLIGYMTYDFTHYSTHHRKPLTFLGRAARRRHLLHHYKYPDACYGVSTGLWDWVFGTNEARARALGKGEHQPDGVFRIVDNEVK